MVKKTSIGITSTPLEWAVELLVLPLCSESALETSEQEMALPVQMYCTHR